MGRMLYGVPYRGSKNQIADKIIEQLPPAKHFYDVFAGGCAITHAALLSGKYKYIHASDIDTRGMRLFWDGIEGEFKDEDRWITREDFHRQKATNPYIALCWSFSNNMEDYLYGKDIENVKKNFFEKREAYTRNVGRLNRVNKNIGMNIESVTFAKCSFEKVDILEDSVVYCDIPYRNTQCSYRYNFDYEEFYKWAENHKNCYVSEYEMPNDRFKIIYEIEKIQLTSNSNNKRAKERLYVPK